jgi:hypothetical protein
MVLRVLSVSGRMRGMLTIHAAPNNGVNTIFLIFGALLFIGNVSRAQSDKHKPELFTS